MVALNDNPGQEQTSATPVAKSAAPGIQTLKLKLEDLPAREVVALLRVSRLDKGFAVFLNPDLPHIGAANAMTGAEAYAADQFLQNLPPSHMSDALKRFREELKSRSGFDSSAGEFSRDELARLRDLDSALTSPNFKTALDVLTGLQPPPESPYVESYLLHKSPGRLAVTVSPDFRNFRSYLGNVLGFDVAKNIAGQQLAFSDETSREHLTSEASRDALLLMRERFSEIQLESVHELRRAAVLFSDPERINKAAQDRDFDSGLRAMVTHEPLTKESLLKLEGTMSLVSALSGRSTYKLDEAVRLTAGFGHNELLGRDDFRRFSTALAGYVGRQYVDSSAMEVVEFLNDISAPLFKATGGREDAIKRIAEYVEQHGRVPTNTVLKDAARALPK